MRNTGWSQRIGRCSRSRRCARPWDLILTPFGRVWRRCVGRLSVRRLCAAFAPTCGAWAPPAPWARSASECEPSGRGRKRTRRRADVDLRWTQGHGKVVYRGISLSLDTRPKRRAVTRDERFSGNENRSSRVAAFPWRRIEAPSATLPWPWRWTLQDAALSLLGPCWGATVW